MAVRERKFKFFTKHDRHKLRICTKFPLRMNAEERAILRVTSEVAGISKSGLFLSLLYERFDLLSRENPWMVDAVDTILALPEPKGE